MQASSKPEVRGMIVLDDCTLDIGSAPTATEIDLLNKNDKEN